MDRSLSAAVAVLMLLLCGCALGDRTPGIAFVNQDPAWVSEVVPGKLYRSGQLTAHGLEKAIEEHGIRTVVNLRGDSPDPDLGGGRREPEFCASKGVRYEHNGVYIEREELFPNKEHPERPLPPFVEEFLATMDDPTTGPVLIHCFAGKHRTGVLIGTYRILRQGRGAAETAAEMMAYGFEPKNFQENPHIMPYLEHLEATSVATRNKQGVSALSLAK